MTAAIDLPLLLLIVVLSFGAGWQVESWHIRSGEVKAITAQEKKDFKIVGGYEIKAQKIQNATSTNLIEWSFINAAFPDDYPLPAPFIKLLRDATAP